MATENVAVLFTDMVGSTALATGLAPDAADDLRREHFAILRQAIAEAGGSEVKNLGDGLMVVFASMSASLSCAVGMQQGIERDNRRRERLVGLRVGISGGEVTREDDDYFGDAVIEAARLCATCEGGQILVADVVRAMAGRRSKHRCTAVGPLSLKGLPDPVDTVEVHWEPLESSAMKSVPLPTRLAVEPLVGLFGRAHERASILDAFKRVAGGDGREVLLVSGEPGMGKTTLAADAARATFESGACVLFGHCEEDLATPYQLFSEALGHYVTHISEDQLTEHVAIHGSELASLVPALARRIPGLPPSKATDTDAERFLLFAAAVGLLAVASQHQPVVLVLDDIQWADKASLQLLRHLIASEQTMRLLVLATYRDAELSQSHPLLDALAALRRQAGVSRIELSGLEASDVLALMNTAAGHPLDDTAVSLAHAVHRETDGNPFFVNEVFRHLAETGAVSRDATGRWAADESLEAMPLPDSIREVIGARVGRMGPDAGQVLAIASVIGRDFDLDLLARATNTSEDDLLDMLEVAASAALVRETDAGRYSFAHALVQHTLYQDLGHSRRARAHRRVAEALEDLCRNNPGARVGELARHWFSATQPVDLTKAIRYSRLAGDAALRALAPANALRYYAQALDLYPQASNPDPHLGIDLAIGLGTAQRQMGDPAYRQTLLDAARRAADLGDTDRLAASALANSRGWFSTVGVVDAEKVATLELALARLPADHPDRALVLSTLCMELSYATPLERRQALIDEALALAESSGDDATIVRVLNHGFTPLNVPELLEQSLARTADALVRAERLGDPVLLFFAASWRSLAALGAGDVDEMDRCSEITGKLADQLDQPTLTWTCTFTRSMRAQIAGDTDLAERLATESLQIGTEGGERDASVYFGILLAMTCLQRGTLGDLVPMIEEMAASSPDLATGQVGSFLAGAYAEGNRPDDVKQQLSKFAASGFELPVDNAWLNAMLGYAGAATICQDTRFAMDLFDRLVPYADQWAVTRASTDGPVSQHLGGLAAILGRYVEAEKYLSQAAVSNERAGAKFFAARTNLVWGLMLSERNGPGDIEQARTRLAAAHTVAESQGYANLARRAAEAMVALAD